MATFTAAAASTNPPCNYQRSATMDDAAFGEILDCVRGRFGQVPALDADGNPILAENGQPTLRDMTNEECVNRMLGSMLAGWTQNAAVDKAEALRRQAAATVAPATWIVA